MIDGSPYTIYPSSASAWAAMYHAVRDAKKSIYWELYIFVDDEIGDRFFDLLEQKAGEGVDVKIIVDYLGSFGLSRKRTQQLKKAGVDLQFFHERKRRLGGVWRRLLARTHRKLLMVDEKIGFIGGVNIQKRMLDWLDIHIKITGRPVRSMLRAFAKMYVICGGEKSAVAHLFKYRLRVNQEEHDVEFIYDDSHPNRSKVRALYTRALKKAKSRVILFSPYYIPDKQFLRALWQARRRGVRIDLLIPFRTDVRIATYVAYSFFGLMKKYGVHVHLMKKMMHGKGIVVDDDWAVIGSSNLDQGSFYTNYEANVKVKNKRTVRKLKDTLQSWMRDSVELKDVAWETRGWTMRLKEWIAKKLYSLLYRER